MIYKKFQNQELSALGLGTARLPVIGGKNGLIDESAVQEMVDYFDFYLIHNVCSVDIDAYLDDEQYGIYTYLTEQKKNGRIRHLGFSVHGDYEVTKRFLEAYGKGMEFGQIQLNWMDYDFQDAKRKIELFREYQIPVWVM